ncbi:ABC transporter substrate-binding protein [Halopiger goleimassiliensis]|uniref:ABC transporter substrate-binding protein n=1 Tax=Halopiger goleimassiliensis TaxID=1293048 RepID=UPI000678194B|nr:ABC transporter substrate-binding protein [Halopiger goleimassiliensis]
MVRRETPDGVSTRRGYLGAAGAVAAGLAAGCLEGDGADGTGDDGSEPTDDEVGDDGNAGATDEETGDAYSVTMEPVGTVEFEAVPETWFPYTGDYADMGVALGQADGLLAIGIRARYGTHLYDELPGVSVDADSLTELWQDGTDQELFYELDADVHVIDPNFLKHRLEWDDEDLRQVEQTVGPFVGNTIFSRVYDWHDYREYSLYEAFGKLASVFRETKRYEAFAAYHDEIVADVQSRLPDEQPEVAVLYPDDVPPEAFYPYRIGSGTQSKHWRDLEVADALAGHGITDAQAGGGMVDFEDLLEIDPDVLAIRLQGEITPEYFDAEIRSALEDHPAASQLTAVQNDRVVYGGLTYQGPIIHLFQLERAAQGIYPDVFGDEPLFDRQRVADVVNGEF